MTTRKISLLFAEDDAQAREMLENLIRFKFPELTLYVAADGEQGVDLFREQNPDFVLTDIMMPVLDGLEMTRRIREIRPDAFVIALTAYNDPEWQRRCSEVNFNKCLYKPIEFPALLGALKDAISLLDNEKKTVA
jgi:CheY-like chemotaxis protein